MNKHIICYVLYESFNDQEFDTYSQNEREFFARLRSLSTGVYHYEDPLLQEKALSVMPVTELRQRAKERSEKSKEEWQDGVDERDCLLLEVLGWFGL